MSQPVAYNPITIFVSFEGATPTFPGHQIDGELNALKATTDQIRTNLALIQRDDGKILNQTVSYDQLDPVLAAGGLSPLTAWISSHAYTKYQVVLFSGSLYTCLISHTSSSSFATDLGAGDWVLLAALPTVPGPQGPQGATGATGAAGAAGSAGPSGAGYLATSTTSLVTAGSGSKNFTTQAGLAYSVGARIRATSAGTAEWMEGVITSYSGTALIATMDGNSGTGTHADWNINLAGVPGANGSGVAGQTVHSVVIAASASTLGTGVLLTDGQLVVGQTGADPLAKTLSGDGTLAASGAITITKTSGVPFAASATTDATNATNISSGTLANARLTITTAAQWQANTSGKILTTDTVWSAAALTTLTDAATVTPDFSTGFDFIWTLGAVGRTLANATNPKVGQKGVIYLVQDGTGSRTITTWGTQYKFAGGVKPTLSTAANAVDVLSYCVKSATEYECFFTANMS